MSKLFALAAGLSLTLAMTPVFAAGQDELVYFGSHGPSTPGQGGPGGAGGPRGPGGGPRGPRKPVNIYAARFDESTGMFTPLGVKAQLARPTWFVANPEKSVIYSDNEIGTGPSNPGQVVAFRYDPANGDLKEISRVGAVGGGTTFVTFDPVTQTVFAANFNTGHVVAIPVKPNGTLGQASSFQLDYGSSTNPRQKGPHAHAIVIAPNHKYILVPDMGANRLFVYRFDDATRTLSPAATPYFEFPPGTGPRHAVFDPSGKHLYVMTELTAQIYVFAWDAAAGTLKELQSLSTYPDAPKNLLTQDGAEIAISSDGRFLYTSTRSDNSVDAWAINPSSGRLTHLQRIGAQGKDPWSFTISPNGRWLLVTDTNSNKVAVLKIDRATGKLSATGIALDVPGPVSATFVGG